jgi:hypothetical protein
MTTKTWMKGKRHILIAGALGLFSQAALSGEANASSTQEVLRVTAPRLEVATAELRIETNTDAVIEAINRRIAKDLERSLEAIGNKRIEIAASEFPTRG